MGIAESAREEARAAVQYRKLKDKKYDWQYLDANLGSVLFWNDKWKDAEEIIGALAASDAIIAAADKPLQPAAN